MKIKKDKKNIKLTGTGKTFIASTDAMDMLIKDCMNKDLLYKPEIMDGKNKSTLKLKEINIHKIATLLYVITIGVLILIFFFFSSILAVDLLNDLNQEPIYPEYLSTFLSNDISLLRDSLEGMEIENQIRVENMITEKLNELNDGENQFRQEHEDKLTTYFMIRWFVLSTISLILVLICGAYYKYSYYKKLYRYYNLTFHMSYFDNLFKLMFQDSVFIRKLHCLVLNSHLKSNTWHSKYAPLGGIENLYVLIPEYIKKKNAKFSIPILVMIPVAISLFGLIYNAEPINHFSLLSVAYMLFMVTVAVYPSIASNFIYISKKHNELELINIIDKIIVINSIKKS